MTNLFTLTGNKWTLAVTAQYYLSNEIDKQQLEFQNK